MRPEALKETGVLSVHPWSDHVIDALGLDPRSFYAETFWLPLLGPTSLWLLRRMAFYFESNPGGFDVDLDEWGICLGVSRHRVLERAARRLVDFELARDCGPTDLDVLRRLPPVSQGRLKRLPLPIQLAHAAWRDDQQLEHAAGAAIAPPRRLAPVPSSHTSS